MERSRGINQRVLLGWAGMAGPVLFSMVVIILGFLQPGYNHIEDPISALGEAGAANPLFQSINFIVFGLLVMALASGLYQGIRGGQGRRVGFILLGLFGFVALILSGVFPADEGGAAVTFSGIAHQFASAIGFPSGILSVVLIRREMKHDPKWEDLAQYSLITGFVAMILLVLFGSQIGNPDAPLHDSAGLLQRLFVLSLFQWFFVVGYRLRTVSKSEGDSK